MLRVLPGQLDGVYPVLALGHGVRPQLVLPLVLPSVHDSEAKLKFKCLFPFLSLSLSRVKTSHRFLLAIWLLCSVSISSSGQKPFTVTILYREARLLKGVKRYKKKGFQYLIVNQIYSF